MYYDYNTRERKGGAGDTNVPNKLQGIISYNKLIYKFQINFYFLMGVYAHFWLKMRKRPSSALALFINILNLSGQKNPDTGC